MAELEEKNKSTGQTAVVAAEMPAAQAEKSLEQKSENPDKEKKRAFISKGETIHKWGTYYGVDWIFNTIVGVKFAYWGKFTESGQKNWTEPLTRGFTKLLKPIIKNPESLEQSVGKGNMFMSIIAGGMFTIPPLMALEHNKVRKWIVQKLDGVIYGKDTVENDPKFQQAYREIEETPKKDFVTGMTSRFAALAPLLAIVLIPKTRDLSNKIYFDHLSNGSEAIAKGLGFSAEKSIKAPSPAEAKKRWKFIYDSLAMDSGLCLPYAPLHAFFYNMFANSKGKNTPVKKEVNAGAAEEAVLSETQKLNQAQSAGTFAGKISKDVNIVGRPPMTSHDSFTDFAKNDTEQKAQVGL